MGKRGRQTLARLGLWGALAAAAALGAVPFAACGTSTAGTAPILDAGRDAALDDGNDAGPAGATGDAGEGSDDLSDATGGGGLDAPGPGSFDAFAPSDDADDTSDARSSSDASCTFMGSIATSLAASPVTQCPFAMCAAEVNACSADCVCSNAVTRALDCVGSQTGIAVTTTCFTDEVVDLATNQPERDLATCLQSSVCRDD